MDRDYIGMLAGIIVLIIGLSAFMGVLFLAIEQVETRNGPTLEQCNSVNGTWNDKDYIGVLCLGIDQEGYKFLWKFKEGEKPYKVGIRS